MNTLPEFILGIFLIIQLGAFIMCFARGIQHRSTGRRIFEWGSPTLGDILLVIIFLPSFLILLIIDYIPIILAYEPFSKESK